MNGEDVGFKMDPGACYAGTLTQICNNTKGNCIKVNLFCTTGIKDQFKGK